nr:immunoglobulin heavy chain junction region [Macaca mulatta]MOW77328.1 immunoglobulin heavy chain junction region [Macaca mulatta]MOW77998.1 immunoglobulin heavy chain junction region [Macaca mulatta]MOW78658.1 immunoglobulin heavy chain junction region [Macaca mulatta]MOW79215.1 immunoglobulin heavy chain junction region [Macaca mulatta]
CARTIFGAIVAHWYFDIW